MYMINVHCFISCVHHPAYYNKLLGKVNTYIMSNTTCTDTIY